MYRDRIKGWLKHYDFILLDILCLILSFGCSYLIRFSDNLTNQLHHYRNVGLALLLIDIAVIFFASIYSDVLKRGYFKETAKTFYQTCLVIGMETFYLFAVKEGSRYSRQVLLVTGLLYWILSSAVRIGWKAVLKKYSRRITNNTLILATTADCAEEVLDNLKNHVNFHAHISGVAVMDEGEHADASELMVRQYQNVPVVAVERTLLEYMASACVDEMMFVLPGTRKYKLLAAEIASAGIVVHECIGKAEDRTGRRQVVENLGGYTVMTTCVNRMTFRQELCKRLFDIAGGMVGSLIALLAMLIVGPIIYCQSPGPILFKQVRIGRNGRRFNFWKIRSMVPDADAQKEKLMNQNRVKDGMMFKLDFDPRIIGAKRLPDGTIKKGIGNVIRDWSIDELPQFFNVLKGDMSLVGTRPPTVDEWEKYQLHHRVRMAFKPGITGLWQVSGRSNITDFEEVVKLDARYIEEWSFGLDLRILAKTVKAVLKKSGSM